MCVYIYIYICVYTYIHNDYISISLSLSLYIYIYIYIYIHIYTPPKGAIAPGIDRGYVGSWSAKRRLAGGERAEGEGPGHPGL